MTDASANSADDWLDGAVNLHDASGGLSEAVLSAALCGSMEGHLAAHADRESGSINEPMPSAPLPPRDSDVLVARGGFRTLAEGAKVE